MLPHSHDVTFLVTLVGHDFEPALKDPEIRVKRKIKFYASKKSAPQIKHGAVCTIQSM